MLFELKQSTLLVVLGALLIIGSKVNADGQERLISPNSANELSYPELSLAEQEKRTNWKQLQGSWGKRSDDLEQYEADNTEDIVNKRGKWSQLQGSWGKRARDQDHGWLLKNIANVLLEYPELMNSWESRPLKRGWAKFAGSWGKRPFVARTVSPRSTDWSSLRGSWGKRSNNWEQLRGGWGKREVDK